MKSLRMSGLAIAAGGICQIIVNVVFTPMMDIDAPTAELMASQVFLWRTALAALTVFLFMIGSSGLYSYQATRGKLFGKIAYGIAFLGSAVLFAHEWANVFFLHPMALQIPDALQALDDVEGMSSLNLEGLIVLTIFAVGWIAFSISMLLAKVFKPLGPALVIAGFFAVPLITVATSPILGGTLGNLVLGTGFVLLGRELIKSPGGSI